MLRPAQAAPACDMRVKWDRGGRGQKANKTCPSVQQAAAEVRRLTRHYHICWWSVACLEPTCRCQPPAHVQLLRRFRSRACKNWTCAPMCARAHVSLCWCRCDWQRHATCTHVPWHLAVSAPFYTFSWASYTVCAPLHIFLGILQCLTRSLMEKKWDYFPSKTC